MRLRWELDWSIHLLFSIAGKQLMAVILFIDMLGARRRWQSGGVAESVPVFYRFKSMVNTAARRAPAGGYCTVEGFDGARRSRHDGPSERPKTVDTPVDTPRSADFSPPR